MATSEGLAAPPWDQYSGVLPFCQLTLSGSITRAHDEGRPPTMELFTGRHIFCGRGVLKDKPMHTHSLEPWTHDHVFLGHGHARNERRTWFGVGITAIMMVGEIAAGSYFGSMALLAD